VGRKINTGLIASAYGNKLYCPATGKKKETKARQTNTGEIQIGRVLTRFFIKETRQVTL